MFPRTSPPAYCRWLRHRKSSVYNIKSLQREHDELGQAERHRHQHAALYMLAIHCCVKLVGTSKQARLEQVVVERLEHTCTYVRLCTHIHTYIRVCMCGCVIQLSSQDIEWFLPVTRPGNKLIYHLKRAVTRTIPPPPP